MTLFTTSNNYSIPKAREESNSSRKESCHDNLSVQRIHSFGPVNHFISLSTPPPEEFMSSTCQSSAKKTSMFEKIPAFGIICALISVLCFSFNSVIVKLLKFHFGLPGIEVLVIRAFFQFTVCGLCMVCKGYSAWGVQGTRCILLSRALTGTISLCCLFTAFNLVPIGDATTIYFSSPVLVTIFAYFLLSEPFRCIQFVTCFITILGVGFISKPEFIFGKQTDMHYPYQTLGQALAMCAALTSSITIINLRKLKTTPAVVVVFWFAASIMFFGALALFALGTYKWFDVTNLYCMGLLTIIGLMSVSEQYFLTIALQHEDATTISVTRSFNIVLAFLWEVVIFQEQVTWTSIVGAVLVSGCILLLALYKSWIKMRQMGSQSDHLVDIEQSNCGKAGLVTTISGHAR